MKELNLADVSELNLCYELRKNIPFIAGKSTLATYLEELKEFDKKYVSPPIKVAKYFGFVFILVVFSFFSLFFFSEAFSIIVNVFQNTYFIPDNNFLQVLGIPKVLIPAIAISAYLLAGSIMLLADIFFIVSFFVGVY